MVIVSDVFEPISMNGVNRFGQILLRTPAGKSNNLAYFTLFSLKTVVRWARTKASCQVEFSISTRRLRAVVLLDASVTN